MDPTGPDPSPEMTDLHLERPLTELRPAPIALSRDRMLFEAGKASARIGLRHRIVIGGLAAAVVVMGGLLVLERGERHALKAALAQQGHDRRIESVVVPEPPVAPVEISPYSYLALSRLVGPEGLESARLPTGVKPSGGAIDRTRESSSPLRAGDSGRALDF